MPMTPSALMPVIAPPNSVSPHAAVIASLSAADPEPALEQGLAHLSRGGDLPLLLALAAAMVRCDLAVLADALLRSTGPAIEKHPSVQQMLSQIARLPANEFNSREIERRFRANAAAVCARHPELRGRIDPSLPPSGLRFIRSRAGNVHVLRADAAPRFTVLFPFVHHLAHAERLNLPAASLVSSTCMIGVPSEPMLQRLWSQDVGGYRPPIDVIETDIEVLRAWLCLPESTAMVESPRLQLFAGELALAEYATFLVDTPSRLTPSMVLSNHRAGWKAPRLDDAWRSDVERRTNARRRLVKQEVEARLGCCEAAYWRDRFDRAARGEAALNIVGFTNRYSTVVQHAMRDLASAFRRLGHDFEVVSQPDDFSPGVDVAGALAARNRDLIVAINHLRFEYADVMPANVPYVGWIQDHVDHLWKADAGASIGELDMVIAHAPDVLAGLYGYPRKRLLASSNLTDAHTYSNERLSEHELQPFRCDLSFVSHGAATPEQLCDEIERATTRAFGRMMRSFLSLASDRMSHGGCLNAQQLVELMLMAEQVSDHPALTPAIRRSHVYPQIARIHDRLFRHTTLEWAANWARSRGKSLRIHGRGWEHHPTLAAFAAGEVESGRRLRAVYQASTINLQANAYSSLHQRLLDGVACGALVLSRHNPADFVRRPFAVIREFIVEHQLGSLAELLAVRSRDERLALACAEAEHLSGAVIAAAEDPRRLEQIRVMRAANDIAELQSDAGLFEMLREMRFIPARVASDLPGFERTSFRNESQMHEVLDAYIADEHLRHEINGPMREAVLAHDTFDALAQRILHAFARGAG